MFDWRADSLIAVNACISYPFYNLCDYCSRKQHKDLFGRVKNDADYKIKRVLCSNHIKIFFFIQELGRVLKYCQFCLVNYPERFGCYFCSRQYFECKKYYSLTYITIRALESILDWNTDHVNSLLQCSDIWSSFGN
jgi:hypothetical protein